MHADARQGARWMRTAGVLGAAVKVDGGPREVAKAVDGASRRLLSRVREEQLHVHALRVALACRAQGRESSESAAEEGRRQRRVQTFGRAVARTVVVEERPAARRAVVAVRDVRGWLLRGAA